MNTPSKPLPESLLAPIYRAYLDAVRAGDKQPQLGAVIWTRLCINLAKGKESPGFPGNGFAWWSTMLDNAGFTAKKYDNGPRVCEMGYKQLVERMGEPLPVPEPDSPCVNCGTMLPAHTVKRTGGLCYGCLERLG